MMRGRSMPGMLSGHGGKLSADSKFRVPQRVSMSNLVGGSISLVAPELAERALDPPTGASARVGAGQASDS